MWNMTNNVTASKLRLNRENKSFAFLIPEPKVMFYCITIVLVNYYTSFVLKKLHNGSGGSKLHLLSSPLN